MVYEDPDDPKNGISQSDLYQVLAYAVRYKIDEVALLYPDTLHNYHSDVSGFTIRDEFADQIDVRVTAWQLPVINRELMNGEYRKGKKLGEAFEVLEEKLRSRIQMVLSLH